MARSAEFCSCSGRMLTVAFNRYRWEAEGGRVRCGLQLGGVMAVKARNIRRDLKDAVISLLTVSFEPGEAPGGVITLAFSGGGDIAVTVECVDAALADVFGKFQAAFMMPAGKGLDGFAVALDEIEDDEALLDAIVAGASGYVLKQIRGTDLIGAVRTVAAGGSLLDPSATARVMQRIRKEANKTDPLSDLTDQERKILDLIGEGMTNRQIGEQLFLAEKTVKNYVSSILSKLGLQRRTQAAVFVAKVKSE